MTKLTPEAIVELKGKGLVIFPVLFHEDLPECRNIDSYGCIYRTDWLVVLLWANCESSTRIPPYSAARILVRLRGTNNLPVDRDYLFEPQRNDITTHVHAMDSPQVKPCLGKPNRFRASANRESLLYCTWVY